MTAVTRLEADIVVVGGGPAGLAAATAAAERDRSVVLVDAFPQFGGQYAMQPPAGHAALEAGRQAVGGRIAIGKAAAAGVHLRSGAEVFGAERSDGRFRLFAAEGADGLVVDAGAVIVATGAMERPLPFPGWTLPGVIGAGAAQRLIKTGGVAPGERVMLAGTGPFLDAVAATFHHAGLPLALRVELAPPLSALVAALARHPERWAEAAGLRLAARATKPVHLSGWAVVEGLGETHLEAVRVAPVGADGRADLARAEIVESVDCLAVGYGFRPIVDLTALLKAEHRYIEAAGGWVCRADPWSGATSVAGLFACGETTGIAGAVPARLSGRLAGSAAAAFVGGAAEDRVPDPAVCRRLTRARRFADRLSGLFPFPAALAAQLRQGAVICRCEEVTSSAVDAAIADGARTVTAVKMWTRAGMGPCQGRICGPALAGLVAEETGCSLEEAGLNAPHLPLRPVPIAIVEACLSAG